LGTSKRVIPVVDNESRHAMRWGILLEQSFGDQLLDSVVQVKVEVSPKETGGGYTPWHMDQFYWPLVTDRVATAWIPLHAVPLEQGPLMFSVGSQRIRTGHGLEISDESERVMSERLKLSNLPVDETPFDLGEVSIHLGRTFHRAGPNTTPRPREVMTIIYMDRDMRLAEPRNKHQGHNWNTKVGDIIASPLNPALYEKPSYTSGEIRARPELPRAST
jgi:ectoine hydroxylase-related dioxygenase (phytanoyl-CoA dioxygenase family)